MKPFLSFLLVFLLLVWTAGAQTQSPAYVRVNPPIHASGIRTVPLGGTTRPSNYDTAWQPAFFHNNASENESEDNEQLEEAKRLKTIAKYNCYAPGSTAPAAKGTAIAPIIGKNFKGNTGSGSCPFDNTLAVSNGGKIITLINSNLRFCDTNGNVFLFQDIFDWYNSSSLLSSSICDPKVIYDAGSDRFIFYTQTCDADPSTSQIIIAFSTTNNPTDPWNWYALSGDPLGDNSWWDFPKLAVTNNAVWVTGNLFSASGNFNQSVMYEIKKSDGYTGAASLTNQVWSGFDAFTLMPVQGGQNANYGPGVYVVATDNGTFNSNKIHLFEFTADFGGGSTVNAFDVTTTTYSIGGEASMQDGTHLNIGDCRVQSGFFLNGIIHFVFHSDAGSGWNGVNYNRLNVSSHTNISTLFSNVGTEDYCYPSVASFTLSGTDKSVAIVFLSADPSGFPSIKAVSCDDAMGFSSAVLVKAGQGNISACASGGDAERWGDYTGAWRRHTSFRPSVWVAGQKSNTSSYWDTWVAELHISSTGVETVNNDVSSAAAFPVPVVDLFTERVVMKQMQHITITLIDVSGKTVKALYDGIAREGENTFSFNKGMLSAGTYFVQIKSAQSGAILSNEKIIISN